MLGPQGEQSAPGLTDLCAALVSIGADDAVCITPASQPGTLMCNYAFDGGMSVLRFVDDLRGTVIEGYLSQMPSYQLGVINTILIGGLLGRATLSVEAAQRVQQDPVLAAALQYFHCRQAAPGTECSKAAHLVRRTVEVSELDRMLQLAQEKWDKVDGFLRAGREADANDTDLDALDELVASYAHARVLSKPEFRIEAQRLLDATTQMLAEFEASPALRSFVIDEGAYHFVESKTYHVGASAFEVGTYIHRFAGYRFTTTSAWRDPDCDVRSRHLLKDGFR